MTNLLKLVKKNHFLVNIDVVFVVRISMVILDIYGWIFSIYFKFDFSKLLDDTFVLYLWKIVFFPDPLA